MSSIGYVNGNWIVINIINDEIYKCKCSICNFEHLVSKNNFFDKISCATCPSKKHVKSPISDIMNMFGGLLGIDDKKKQEIDNAFNALDKPEFKNIYSSLERSSKSIKDVMSGEFGTPDIARKILETEAVTLKNAFDVLIKDGKITKDEVNTFKTEIHSDANFTKIKSVLETVRRQYAPEKNKV